ncbi:MAG TPA: matrixin family metalloprotease, partial [Gemmata sp.]|nr:matrixin family metalloprotease [Gemmata sp.]
MSLRTGASAATVLRLESLEAREVPAIAIQVDYSLDLRANGGSGFFEDHADARTVMNRVAQEMSQRVSANLSAINPSGSNTWDALFYNPETGTTTSVRNLHVAANTLVIFVGMRAMPGGEAGQGGFGGYSWSGTSAWGDRLLHRGSSGFTPWGGSIGFDSTENWHFGLTTSGLASNELDFYSVATHELGHLLGIGTSNQWFSHVQNGKFTGSYAESVYGGPVPLDPSGAHWADGILNNGQPVSLDPTLNYGVRVTWTSLDEAGLRHVGWGAGSPPSPPVSPPPAVPPTLPPVGSQTRLPVLVAGPNGRVDVYARGNDGTLTFSG